MSPLEALCAATAGGAAALRLDDGTGTLAEGAPADVVWWSVPDHREIPYHVGVNRVGAVWIGGERVAGRTGADRARPARDAGNDDARPAHGARVGAGAPYDAADPAS